MQPQKIGRYRVLNLLGQGGMGVVYSARDDQMGRDVAVKMMTNNQETDPTARARFFREAQLTSRLLHRNVVTLLDLGEEDGHPFIVMELLKGSTLSRALREPRLDGLEPKLDLMIQTCEGLARAHTAGVVHRDVKPSNLFVLPDGSLKILDFGVARLTDSSMTRAGRVVGTPDYMSPEQARGDEVDPRSDVFSAAAVFYFMITGRKPFEAPDVPSVLRKVINEDPLPIPHHEETAPLARIIMRALKKNPESRYQRCADMAIDLTRVKRHYDAETRQMGAGVQAQFNRVLLLTEGLAKVREQLGLTPVASIADHAAEVRDRFPFLCRGPNDSGSLPALFRRDQLSAIAGDLRTVRDAVAGELEELAVDAAEQHRRVNSTPGHVDAATKMGELVRAEKAPREPHLRDSRNQTDERALVDLVLVGDTTGDDARSANPNASQPATRGVAARVKKAAGTFSRWLPGGRRRANPPDDE